MENLAAMIEQSASAAMSAEPGDVDSLAKLHTYLLSVRDLTTGPEMASGKVHTSADRAVKLIEQILGGDGTNAGDVLAETRRAIADLQEMVHSALAPAPVPSAPKPPTREPASAPTPDSMTEQPIKSDDLPLVTEFVGEAMDHMAIAEASLLALEGDPNKPEEINSIFRGFHTIKGVAGFLNLKQISALAHTAENLLDRARKGKLVLSGSSVDLILNSVDIMRRLVRGVAEAANVGAAPARQEALDELLRRLTAALDPGEPAAPAVVAKAAPVPTTPPPAAPVPQTSTTPAPAPTPTPSPVVANATKSSSTTTTSGEVTVKVSTERLDALIDTVGELVIAQAMVSQDVTAASDAGTEGQRLARNMSHLGKITRSLQDLSMAMRMVPIQGVFQKMARLARDVARKGGKEIDFVHVGDETELDRNVVEAVSDPLVHMVRNAIDHGIETPEKRLQLGKSRTGKVQLKAYHHSGNVVVEISDDGGGLNKSKIVAKAVICGIVKEGQSLEEEEIFRLIFHPGLSTAEKATDISGRGVGMDVARKNVEALRGRIEIASQEGRGSVFTIRLPLTLAVIDGLVVRVGRERYIIPITSVEQSLRPLAEQISTVQAKGEMCLIRGRLLPLVRLSRIFGVKGASEDPATSLVVLVQADQGSCCLMVDEVLGQQQVVIKSLGEKMGRVGGISGGAILGDGNVSLIVDIPGLMDLSKRS